MQAEDIMCAGANVLTVKPEDSIYTAIRMMLKKGISGLPVVGDSGALVGMVTEGDFLRRHETETTKRRSRWIEYLIGPRKLAEEYVHAYGRKIGQVMSTPAVCIAPNRPLKDVVEMMQRHRVKRLAVVDNGRLVGLITRSDLLRALARATVKPASSGDDATIRSQLQSELDKQTWAPMDIHIDVRDGTITLLGFLTEPAQRTAIRVAAENIAGVKRIDDEMIWIEPISGLALGPDEQGGTPKSHR